MLRVAIQKKGRLSDSSMNLLQRCDIRINNGGKLNAKATNFPLEILYLRDDDIPECVADGVADIGIVGENEYLEKERSVSIVERLGFAKCRMSIAVPKSFVYEGISSLQNRKIATSYPKIISQFLLEKKINAEVHEISGSVEIAPNIGMADAIFDIVSTGSTLLQNGLKEVEQVLTSEALLIASRDISKEKSELLEKLMFRVRTVQQAKNYKYVLMNVPTEKLIEITNLLPGMKSPTILPLADKGWSSIHTVIQTDRFWEIIEQVKNLGAEGILITDIENIVL